MADKENPPIRETTEKRETDFEYVTSLDIDDLAVIEDANPKSWQTIFYKWLREHPEHNDKKFTKKTVSENCFKIWRIA